MRILCVYIETSSLWAGFVNKNRWISVRLVSEEVKSIKFDNFDNSHISFLWPEYFIDFFMWKMDPMSGFDIRLVFTLPPSDSTLQYKRCVHLWFWNKFPCIITYSFEMISTFVENKRIKQLKKMNYLIHPWSDKGFKGTLVNKTCHSETWTMCTVP